MNSLDNQEQYHAQQTHAALYSNPENSWGDPTCSWQTLPYAEKQWMKETMLDRCKDIFKFKEDLPKEMMERGIEQRHYGLE